MCVRELVFVLNIAQGSAAAKGVLHVYSFARARAHTHTYATQLNGKTEAINNGVCAKRLG